MIACRTKSQQKQDDGDEFFITYYTEVIMITTNTRELHAAHKYLFQVMYVCFYVFKYNIFVSNYYRNTYIVV